MTLYLFLLALRSSSLKFLEPKTDPFQSLEISKISERGFQKVIQGSDVVWMRLISTHRVANQI